MSIVFIVSMIKKKKFLFVFLIALFLFFSSHGVRAKQKELSIKKDSCTVFIQQTAKSKFQKINCTNKSEYPIPFFGYDNNHCVVLKRVHIWKGINNQKIFKNNEGLYCSMDGYADNASWWYVK